MQLHFPGLAPLILPAWTSLRADDGSPMAVRMRYDWAKVYCDFLRHPKIVDRPDCDVRLFLGLILHAKEYAPETGVVMLSPGTMRSAFGVKAPLKDVVAGLAYFIAEGLLLQEGAGVRIRDFAARQSTPAVREQEPSKLKGKVYFIRAMTSGRVKIGFSQNPWARIAKLRGASSEPLELLACMPGTFETEKMLHLQFKHLQINREWFTGARELLMFISELVADGYHGGSEVVATTKVATGSATTQQLQQEVEVEVEKEEEGSSHVKGRSGGETRSDAVDNADALLEMRMRDLAQAQDIRLERAMGNNPALGVDKPNTACESVDNPVLEGLSSEQKSKVQALAKAGNGVALTAYLASLRGAP